MKITTPETKIPTIEDVRAAAIEAAVTLSVEEHVATEAREQAKAASEKVSVYFGLLARKFASAKVVPSKDARKAGEVPDLDKVFAVDEAAQLAAVAAMSDDQLLARGWRRVITNGKASIDGYSLSKTWKQYKSNVRAAIINRVAASMAEGTEGPLSMQAMMKAAKDARHESRVEAAREDGDTWTLALVQLAATIEQARELGRVAKGEKASPDIAKRRAAIERAIAKFAEAVDKVAAPAKASPINDKRTPTVSEPAEQQAA